MLVYSSALRSTVISSGSFVIIEYTWYFRCISRLCSVAVVCIEDIPLTCALVFGDIQMRMSWVAGYHLLLCGLPVLSGDA